MHYALCVTHTHAIQVDRGRVVTVGDSSNHAQLRYELATLLTRMVCRLQGAVNHGARMPFFFLISTSQLLPDMSMRTYGYIVVRDFAKNRT